MDLQEFNLGPSMFPELGAFKHSHGPTVEEMEKARERALYQKSIKCTSYNVKIYDMHDLKQAKAYQDKIIDILDLVNKGQCVVYANDRQLLTRNGSQSWYRYLEWAEYVLEVEKTPTIGEVVTANKEGTVDV